MIMEFLVKEAFRCVQKNPIDPIIAKNNPLMHGVISWWLYLDLWMRQEVSFSWSLVYNKYSHKYVNTYVIL